MIEKRLYQDLVEKILYQNGHAVPITRAVVQRLCGLGVAKKDIDELQELADDNHWSHERLVEELVALSATVLSEAPASLPA